MNFEISYSPQYLFNLLIAYYYPVILKITDIIIYKNPIHILKHIYYYIYMGIICIRNKTLKTLILKKQEE